MITPHNIITAAWFVEVISHDKTHETKAFSTRDEALTFMRLIPILQNGGEWLHIARAILRPSHLTLN